MKRVFATAMFVLLGAASALGQRIADIDMGAGVRFVIHVVDGDTLRVVLRPPVTVYGDRVVRSKSAQRAYDRYVENFKKVYPIAKEANAIFSEMEAFIPTLKNNREVKRYTTYMEGVLKDKYTPIIKNMTFSQGKMLIKLIDRETSHTAHAHLKEFRGGFTAAMWQGVARLFGANLKDDYDPNGEDQMIEILVFLYEAGKL